MPRISLFKPEKGNDYKFIDRNISETFQIGGTDLYLHKYLGPRNPNDEEATADQPQYDQVKETNIQDLLFLENRDRKYDPNIYTVRGIYNVQDIDFNLSQFALFIDNDTVFMVVHINDFIKLVGRKPISGDVIELPHLRDEFALNDFDISLPRYYTISDVGRAAEGFSPTWYPHLYRLKLTKLNSQQQFADILNKPANDTVNYKGEVELLESYSVGDVVKYQGKLYSVIAPTIGNLPPDSTYFAPFTGPSIEDLISNKNQALMINDAILSQAHADAPMSGYETRHYYTLAADSNGNPALTTTDSIINDASSDTDRLDASRVMDDPIRDGYTGYLLGDGQPPNNLPLFGHGIAFPASAITGDYFLRTDFMPNRLFRYDGLRWIKREDNVRHELSNTDTRANQKGTFINNTNSTIIGGKEVVERQSLSKALKPKADL